MMIINGWIHVAILVIAIGCSALWGTEASYAKMFGVEFFGAHATFLGMMIKWFIACGLVEFVISIYALIGSTLKED